jgi:glycerate dehydrogenase
MKIVVLDGHTLNPGDLEWNALSSVGPFTVHERTSLAETVPRSLGAEALLTNKTPLGRETIRTLPDLRYIGVLATGYDVVDVAAAAERNITVTNVPAYGTHSVAQLVFAHLFNLTHRIAHHTTAVRAGRWTSCPDFSFWDYPLTEVDGLTMGIVGLGRIGARTAQAARCFGMNVLAADRSRPVPTPEGVRMVSLEEVFAASDVISLHCPATPATRGMVDTKRLSLMKPTAVLINTSRGTLIDESALAEALNEGRIAGAGLDVLSLEPPNPDNPLLTAHNCFITPHFAWGTTAARGRLLAEVVENLKAFTRGERRNVVST